MRASSWVAIVANTRCHVVRNTAVHQFPRSTASPAQTRDTIDLRYSADNVGQPDWLIDIYLGIGEEEGGWDGPKVYVWRMRLLNSITADDSAIHALQQNLRPLAFDLW